MPQSILDTMDFEQLSRLATSRKINFQAHDNCRTLREKITEWEINRGLHQGGLKELISKNDPTSQILEALNSIQSKLVELEGRILSLETKNEP